MIKLSRLSIGVAIMAALCGLSIDANTAGGYVRLLVQQLEQVANDNPAYTSFKGVSIGTPLTDARQKLGNPTEKNDEQDYYMLNDKTTAQVFYDQDKKVYALSVTYLGDKNTPTVKQIFGSEVAANADGSIFKRVNYSKAGYWVAYNRTKGDDPMVTITMQKNN